MNWEDFGGSAMRTGYPDVTSPTMRQALDFVREVFSEKGHLPCTLLVVDEVQQFIGEKIPRANDLQEIAEHCCTDLESRVLIVGTGQSALNTTPSLQRLAGPLLCARSAFRHRCRERHPQDRAA